MQGIPRTSAETNRRISRPADYVAPTGKTIRVASTPSSAAFIRTDGHILPSTAAHAASGKRADEARRGSRLAAGQPKTTPGNSGLCCALASRSHGHAAQAVFGGRHSAPAPKPAEIGGNGRIR